jgi:hypothetical protein
MKHVDATTALRCALGLALAGSLTVYAAKGDKTADEKRIEKIERKMERQSAADALAAAIAERKAMAATAPMPEPSRSDRSSGDSSRRSRSSRGEYREPTTPADAKYDAFRIIVERNIFNPTRIGRTRDRSEERQPRVDTIALVGTMQSEKGVVAFFDSPDSAYRKTLREGQSVGDFKVQKIQPNEVQLERNGKPVSLKVAEQLRRPEGSDWSVAAVEPPAGDAPGASGAPTVNPNAPVAIPADASDAVRRMMEARNKALKQ